MKIERFLSQEDAANLSRLAEHLLRVRDVKINFAEKLIDLIATSILLPENAQRKDCVSLHSKVTYRAVGTNDSRSIFIIYPHDANEALARVSILAPLPMSLLGRLTGSIVDVALPFNQVRFIEIMDVQIAPFRAAEPSARLGTQVQPTWHNCSSSTERGDFHWMSAAKTMITTPNKTPGCY
jgi:regulator of nucleoside diphosphate kinase